MSASSKSSKKGATSVNQSSRQMKAKSGGANKCGSGLGPITEEELSKKDRISPDDVLRLTKATESTFNIIEHLCRAVLQSLEMFCCS